MADSIDEIDEEPALTRMVSALARGGVANGGRSPAVWSLVVVRLGTGAVVLPARVLRPPRSAMLVQPQERLLSQHLQAWFAGGGSSSLAIDEDAHHRYRCGLLHRY